MLHIEGDHLAQPEAQYRKDVGFARGQGIEVQYKDADGGVRQHQRDGARVRSHLAESRTKGRCDGVDVANVGLTDAWNQRAGRQRHKCVDRRLTRAGSAGADGCQNSVRSNLHCRRGTSRVLGANLRLVQDRFHYRDASINVTLLISLSVVRPRRTRSNADSRRKLMPSLRASLRTSEVGFLSRINSRIGSVKSSNS